MADLDAEWKRDTAERHFAVYTDYARTLRIWLVAYGVGGPVLFATGPGLTEKLIASGRAREIITVFLLGVAAQVLSAAINKSAAWYLYAALVSHRFRESHMYKAASWISDRFWIDLVLDAAAVTLFAWATVATLAVIAP